MKNKKTNKKFKVTVKSFSLPEEEKKKVLFQCYDLMFSDSDFIQISNKNKEFNNDKRKE